MKEVKKKSIHEKFRKSAQRAKYENKYSDKQI